MRRFMTFGLVAFLLSAVPASGSLFWDHVSFDGIVDEFKDASTALAFDNNSNGVIDQGDQLVGLIRFGYKWSPFSEKYTYNNTEQLVAAYALEVTNTPGDGGLMTVGPIASTDANSLYQLSNSGIQGLLPSTTDWDNSIFILLEKNGVSNPLDQIDPGMTVIDGVIGNTASGWTVDLIGGIVSATDFMEAIFASVDLSVILNQTPGNEVGYEAAGFTIQYSNRNVPFAPVEVTHFDLTTVTTHDLTFTARVQATDAPNWTTQDSSNFRFNALPEPSSVVIWFLLIGVFGWAVRHRRQRA